MEKKHQESDGNKITKQSPWEVDWERIRADYVHGWYEYNEDGTRKYIYPTLRKLMEKYDVSNTAICSRSRREKWVLQRDQFRQKITKRRHAELGVMKFRESSRYDADNIVRLERFGKLIDRFIEEKENDVENDLNIKDIKTGVEVLEKIHSLTRNIFGEPVGYDKAYEEAVREVEKAINEGNPTTKNDVLDMINAIKSNTVDVGVTDDGDLTVLKKVEEVNE